MKKFVIIGSILILGGIAFAIFSGKNENYLANIMSLSHNRIQKVKSDTCLDSDGGINYIQKGTITTVINGYTRTEEDTCNANGTLRERFCGQPGHPAGLLRSENYVNCENGCNNGMCIEESHCEEGFILDGDREDSPFNDGNEYCKPKLMNLVASNNDNDYLGNDLFGIEIVWADWNNYTPLAQQTEDLIENLETEEGFVFAISNWVKHSKPYGSDSTSPANNNEVFTNIWNATSGVCLDAATISTAMLRMANIPSIQAMVDINHITTLYKINNLRYNVDTTFCQSCGDISSMSLQEAEGRIYSFYNRAGHFENDDEIFCENNFCLETPFSTNKIMPISNHFEEAEIVFPSLDITPNYDLPQIKCGLQAKKWQCDNLGCFINDSYDIWDSIDILYRLENTRNIGYNYTIVPALDNDEIPMNYRFICKKILTNETVANYEFILDEGDLEIITYENLIKDPNAEQEDFDKIKDMIKETTENLGIDPYAFDL